MASQGEEVTSSHKVQSVRAVVDHCGPEVRKGHGEQQDRVGGCL